MDGAGEGFLAAARLTDDQDRKAVARGLRGDGERGAEFGGRATRCSRLSSGAIFSDKGASSPCARRRSAWAASASSCVRRRRAWRGNRGARAHRADRERDRAAVGKHDDRHFGGVAAKRGDEVGPLSSSHGKDRGAHFAAMRPCSRPWALSAQAAPTTLHPARAAMAVRWRRSTASASPSSRIASLHRASHSPTWARP